MSTMELPAVFRGSAPPVIRAEVELALVADTLSSSMSAPDAAPADLPCVCAEPGAGAEDRPLPLAVVLAHHVLLVLLSVPVLLLAAVLIAAASR
jgi:hypothetical protein